MEIIAQVRGSVRLHTATDEKTNPEAKKFQLCNTEIMKRPAGSTICVIYFITVKYITY